MTMTPRPPDPRRITTADVVDALRAGLRMFHQTAAVSAIYAGCVALVGVTLLAVLLALGLSAMALPLIGGFLLVAPALLAGFFGVSRGWRRDRAPGPGDILDGFRNTPRDLWVLMLVCTFLFVIWETDAGILYSFMVGDTSTRWTALLPLSALHVRFQLGAAVAGLFFAIVVFFITAYAVPLLIDRRATLVTAVSASVRAILRSAAANLVWSAILATTIFAAVALPLLLTVVLPVMAFASESLYHRVFGAADSTER